MSRVRTSLPASLTEPIAKLIATAKSPFSSGSLLAHLLRIPKVHRTFFMFPQPPSLLAYPIGYGFAERARVGKRPWQNPSKIIDFSWAISFAIGSYFLAGAGADGTACARRACTFEPVSVFVRVTG